MLERAWNRTLHDHRSDPGRSGARAWDVELDFVPTFVQGPNVDASPVSNSASGSGPDLFSALRDQLGLKLESGKARIEYLVIDHVERPQS